VPQTGEVWRHPNARVAYLAQHAFHHIENHMQRTPNEYIRWRYANGGEDKESLVKVYIPYISTYTYVLHAKLYMCSFLYALAELCIAIEQQVLRCWMHAYLLL
jgi:hypothetical protein